jgi:SAM-dependent methyltransferase
MKSTLVTACLLTLHRPLFRWLKSRRSGSEYNPPVGWVRFGSLRRLAPISRHWGFNRGTPIDRFYIAQFLRAYSADIHGNTLEVGTDTYTRSFGGDRVVRGDVLHLLEGNPQATIVGDLTQADHIVSDQFDAVILTQVLPFIYDANSALRSVFRILKPGGVVLVTVPGISQISRKDMDQWGDYWRFTSRSITRLFCDVFGEADVKIIAYGNVLSAISFLHGLAAEELLPEELAHRDPDYEVIIAVRAVKRASKGEP